MSLTVLPGTTETSGGVQGREPLLRIRSLRVDYPLRRAFLSRGPVPVLRAIDGVDLSIGRGETVGLVGESGCGKSTLARSIVGLQDPTDGELFFDGQRIDRPRPAWVPRRIQIVFQDPYSSLDPRMTVAQTLGEMLGVHRVVPKDRIAARVDELLELVGLGRGVRGAYPRQLSGGQRQRVGIARALSLEPELLVADEPVSALDVSVQATILGLLEDLRSRLGLTLLLIAHDLAVVRQVSDRVAVMYLGRIVEEGDAEEVFSAPRHPYTQALLRAVPSLHPGRRGGGVAVPGEPPSPFAVPSGCRFHPRCPSARERCTTSDPALTATDDPWREVLVGDPEAALTSADDDAHRAACHFAWQPPSPADGAPLRRHDPTTDEGAAHDASD